MMTHSGKVTWRSPSNIAVVKYWGKKGIQLPANSSISMTLSKCYTETTIQYSQKVNSGTPSFSFLFNGEKNINFEERAGRFLEAAVKELPSLKHLHLRIESSNSFPHSAGIASSASSISALSLCFCSINRLVTNPQEDEKAFFRRASHLARLGSGSACRSVYGGWVLWGKNDEIPDSSDNYAIALSKEPHNIFNDFYDAILIVSSGIKKVTSSDGHKLMESNPFKDTKFKTGNLNAIKLVNALKEGDEQLFRIIAENEAMNLHAMFLTSDPFYVLIKPETLQIIDRLTKFRQSSGLEFSFTLDAGPNIHLLYPAIARERIVSFIKSDLISFCENGIWIDDRIGKGPELVN
ncbi:MAG: diphosphomevalonate decarboxylase [Bacteroidales bacterium]|nr:diphosphomevalonate decarboxylase [Bacteroidales bacterium]